MAAPLTWPYAAPSEVSFGDMPTPSWLNLDDALRTAAQDMDAVIGQRYQLPISLDGDNPEHRAMYFLLKKINRYLVMGRVVIDAAIGHEDSQLQSYGKYHLKEAEAALEMIRCGKLDIPGGRLNKSGDDGLGAGMIVTNRDKRSMVDSFYQCDDFFRSANGEESQWLG